MDGVVVGEPKTVGTMAVQGNSNPTVIMRIVSFVDQADSGQSR